MRFAEQAKTEARQKAGSQNSADLLRGIWASAGKKDRERLLEARGLSKSWAEADTIDDMVKRGGGLVAKDLHSVVKNWKLRNPNTSVVFGRR